MSRLDKEKWNSPGLFDGAESKRLKAEGMETAAEARKGDLELGRRIALELSLTNTEVHADMVGRILKEKHGIVTLGHSAGSLFKGGGWEPVYVAPDVQKRVPSKRKSNHARDLRVWRRIEQ